MGRTDWVVIQPVFIGNSEHELANKPQINPWLAGIVTQMWST